MKNTFFLTVALLLLTGTLCSCSGGVSDDVSYLSLTFKEKGYETECYEEQDSMLSALASDMSAAMKDDPPRGALLGYMYAQNSQTGEMVIEVFVFETAADAKRLVNYLKDSDVFVKGTSALRRDGTVVYMGYLDALKIAESTG